MATKIIAFVVMLSFLKLVDSDSPFYTAAVVEYNPLQVASKSNITANERTVENVKNYFLLLDEINSVLDIVVFPERTITYGYDKSNRTELLEHSTLVPEPSEGVNLCDQSPSNYSQFFINLSCGAKNRSVYIVANLLEKAKCKRCKNKDGWDVYNTNVVFDRNGTLISRYRKYNLFGENELDKPTEVELSTFTTDFNVTFGQFVCFDLAFEKPAVTLVRAGIEEFVYPTMWYSELPFAVALQVQQQWAYENNINLLSSGANNPSRGSGGSGIFEGKRGVHHKEIIAKGGSNIFVANITKRSYYTEELPPYLENDDTNEIDRQALELDNFYLAKEDISPYAYQLINTNVSNATESTLCNGKGENIICCNFRLNYSVSTIEDNNKNSYSYFMVAFNGVRTFMGAYDGGMENCAIIACLNSNFNSCALRFDNYSTISWPITFNNIIVEGNFSNSLDKTQYPNSVRSNLRPLPNSYFEWSKINNSDENSIIRINKLVKSENRLLTFGILGRDYSRDRDPKSSSANKISVKTNIMYCLLYLIISYYVNFTVTNK